MVGYIREDGQLGHMPKLFISDRSRIKSKPRFPLGTNSYSRFATGKVGKLIRVNRPPVPRFEAG